MISSSFMLLWFYIELVCLPSDCFFFFVFLLCWMIHGRIGKLCVLSDCFIRHLLVVFSLACCLTASLVLISDVDVLLVSSLVFGFCRVIRRELGIMSLMKKLSSPYSLLVMNLVKKKKNTVKTFRTFLNDLWFSIWIWFCIKHVLYLNLVFLYFYSFFWWNS